MQFKDNVSSEQKKYDIGYVGWWDSKNFGSAITCFALNRVLKRMGKSVLMIEYPGVFPGQWLDNSYGYQFAKKYYDCSDITTSKDFRRFNALCDTFIVGSDQLWAAWNHKKDSSNYFFLDFVNNEHKKIAYATSFGGDSPKFPENKLLRIGYLLSRFDAVSVREESGVSICRDILATDATWVMDPVFLCAKEDYDEVIKTSKFEINSNYIFSYILDATPDKLAAIRYIAEQKNIKYKIVIDGQKKLEQVQKELDNDPNVVVSFSIEDWLCLIKNSSYVITDSFHAFCFSMIFQKDMIAFTNPFRGTTRFDSIAKITGLKARVVETLSDILNRDLCNEQVDYSTVNMKIDIRVTESFRWLENALNVKKHGPTVAELHYWKIIESERRINSLEKRIIELEALLP